MPVSPAGKVGRRRRTLPIGQPPGLREFIAVVRTPRKAARSHRQSASPRVNNF
jgi:hypothetical protein